TERRHGVTHGGKIDHRGHAGEVLHQNARRPERDLTFGGLGLEPLRGSLKILLGDAASVLVPQQILEQHLHRERQSRNSLQSVLLGGRQTKERISLAANLERLAATKTVERSHVLSHPTGGRAITVIKYRARPMSPVATAALLLKD